MQKGLREQENYLINNYRIKRFGKKILVVTDDGSWLFLDRGDFKLLRLNKVKENQRLFRLLEEKGIIIDKKSIGKVLDRVRKKYDFLWQGTALHIVIPTLRCNQKCIYCHASSKSIEARDYDMDKKTAKRVVDFIFQSPSYYITIEFQGGEPLLRFDIIKHIIEYAQKVNKNYQKRLLFSLVTNFSLMDEEKLDYLIKNRVGICTSLDGHEFLHNKNRPSDSSQGSYSYAVKWIKRLQKEYKTRRIDDRKAGAIITITRSSLSYYKEIADEYIRLGLQEIFLRFLNNLGDARPLWSKINYSAEEYIKFWKKSLDYLIKENKKGKKIREWLTWTMLRKIVQQEEPNYFEQRSPCGAAIGQLTYNYNGDIYSCDEGRMFGEDIFKLGNVKRGSYKKIIGSNKTCSLIAASTNYTQICDNCAYMPFCGLCPVCNYAEQGSIIGKISETNRCKIYKAQFDYIFEGLQKEDSEKIFNNWLKKFDVKRRLT